VLFERQQNFDSEFLFFENAEKCSLRKAVCFVGLGKELLSMENGDEKTYSKIDSYSKIIYWKSKTNSGIFSKRCHVRPFGVISKWSFQ